MSDRPRSLAEVLGEDGLAGLTALSRMHADGWGMAWWDGPVLASHSSHRPAHSSSDYAAIAREVRTDAALLHLRWATVGLAVTPENTHPFRSGEFAFGHNGAVRPAAGLLDLLTDEEVAALRGTTDSERLMHVLLGRVRERGLDDGLRRTVEEVCEDLTPSSLNALLLGRDALTAVCCHGAAEEGAPLVDGPPEDQPGYFDLRVRRGDGVVVVASEPLGGAAWQRVGNGTALVVSRGTGAVRSVDVGTFPAATLERERRRRDRAAAA